MKTAFETAIISRPAEALITDPRPNLKVIEGPANDNPEHADWQPVHQFFIGFLAAFNFASDLPPIPCPKIQVVEYRNRSFE